MKHLAFLLVAALIQMTAFAQFIYSPMPVGIRDFANVRQGGYTSCNVYQLDEGARKLVKKSEYGAQGLLSAIYEYDFDNNGDTVVNFEQVYKYDGKGRLIQSSTQGDGDETRSVYTYDAGGRIIRKQTASIDPPTSIYSYDSKGRLKEIKVSQRMPVTDSNGESTGKSADFPWLRYVYSYDAQGRLTEEREFSLHSDQKDVPAYKTFWEYDVAGNVTKTRTLDSEGSEMRSMAYTWNEKGLLATSLEKWNDGELRTFEYDWK